MKTPLTEFLEREFAEKLEFPYMQELLKKDSAALLEWLLQSSMDSANQTVPETLHHFASDRLSTQALGISILTDHLITMLFVVNEIRTRITVPAIEHE